MNDPLILVVGSDALTERVCAELRSTAGHEVRVVWPVGADADRELLAAGVMDAASIMTLTNDDGLNLAIALRARMLNRTIRIVLRQFDAVLGTKIEQNLPDCTVISPAAHSAATYAGAALDARCFFAIRFPQTDGALLGFIHGDATELSVAGLRVGEAEERLRMRIVALDEQLDPAAGTTIGDRAAVVAFGHVVERPHRAQTHAARAPETPPARPRSLIGGWRRINPIARTFLLSSVIFLLLSFSFFRFALHKSWTIALFYVVETMTNVGFGDPSVTSSTWITLGAIVAMLGGIIFTSIFIGYVSSALTRAQWIALQGMRRIHAHDHVVVCGGSAIASAVIPLLTAAGKRVVVIEPEPDPGLIRRARERDVDLLTGDAHRDDSLDLCDLPNASSVLALTDNDATNLEIALSARARRGDVPLVVRMESDTFAQATNALLNIATFSPGALTAPALAGLSRFPGTRGRVRFAGDDHTIGQRHQGAEPQKPPAEICIPLCVWRAGKVVLLRDFAEMQPFDDVLFAVPLAQFRSP